MRVDPYALALATPLATAHGTISERRGFLVTVERDGVRGVGEAAPLPDWTESYDACRDALRSLDGDASPTDARRSLDGTPAARHAVALADLDADARERGVPLYRALGGDGAVESVPVNATVGDAPPEGTAERVRAAVDAGFRCVKVKVGVRALDADIERLRAVRDAAPDVTLRVDANEAWTRAEGARALGIFEGLDVALVEQPLDAADLAGHAALRGRGVDVALDESVAACGLGAVLDADAADAVVLKPMACGGPDRAVAAGRRARDAGVDPIVTTTYDAVHARTAAVHVAAALAPLRACGLATADALEADLAADPAPVESGRVRVPQGKGNGVPAPPRE
ncbi:chloromuconate cycloisomerase [Halarchaeum grantii]|uniref:o-succinylbenzoate synthase n=1 Tax=Halarchaeum grantii TaxID=1193105 RepID=A0A830ERD3_9EURY|nr:enolase C-terminal domain-like protein [Halarchaeum grantii]GGL22527.1 chloromuconate cycloisomerase [Halarchaeum grantii]